MITTTGRRLLLGAVTFWFILGTDAFAASGRRTAPLGAPG